MKAPAIFCVGLGLAASSLYGAQITAVAAHGWPNERSSNDVPSNAIDGLLSTFTWTTESGNSLEASLGLDFGVSVYGLDRIRLWKLPDGGGGQNVKNLVIEYTNDNPGIGLSSRTWTAVTNMVNGYLGSELMTATAVNSNGTVSRDVHDSSVSGFAALSFDPVFATGVRVRFVNPDFTTFNHYRVAEFEAYDVTPEPSSVWLTLFAAVGVVGAARKRAGLFRQ